MNRRTLITEALVVNEGRISCVDVLIGRNGRIEKISPNIVPKGSYRLVSGKGMYLIPGAIDDQVHFREPGLTHKGTIASESRAAAAGGVTSFIEQPNTTPQTTTLALLDEKLEIGRRSSLVNFGFNFGATNQNLDEVERAVETRGEYFAGIKIFMGSSTGNMLVDSEAVLDAIFKLCQNKTAITHCEDEATIIRNLELCRKKFGDAIPMHYHPLIRSEEACFESSSLAVSLARKNGSRLHVYHVSTEEELELFDNSVPLSEKRITAEVCIHHLCFTSKDYELLGSRIKWNPAVKDARHKPKLLEALCNGTLDVLATDHAPHTEEEKRNPYSTCPSGGPMVQHLVPAGITLLGGDEKALSLFVEKACHNPAILFGIKDRGFIREGHFADLVLVDLHNPWTVSRPNLLYKCEWSPMEGQTFEPKVKYTWVNGHLVYENDNKERSIGIIMDNSRGSALEFQR